MPINNATICYNSGFSIRELEDAIENDERTTRCKIHELKRGKNDEGEKATVAEFRKSDKTGLGDVTVRISTQDGEPGELFHAEVFIKTQNAWVSISRP